MHVNKLQKIAKKFKLSEDELRQKIADEKIPDTVWKNLLDRCNTESVAWIVSVII